MGRAELLVGAGSDARQRKVRDFKDHVKQQNFVSGAVIFAISSIAFAQNPSPSPDVTAQVDANGTATAETERVIVTGSNIPTAEETGPNPVDTYRPGDLEKLGINTATDLTEKLPAVLGASVNQNVSGGVATGGSGDGRTEINLRGLFPKETLVLVDGKRVAPVGIALFSSVDINLIPLPLVDHIDVLKDGASAIYGSDAIAGVFNAVLTHKFRGVEVEDRYGNTNLGASNDAAEREGYLLAGLGDDKTDIVVFAEYYDRDAIFSRDRGISSSADFTRFGGMDLRSSNFPGRVGNFILRPGLTAPTPHSAPSAATSPDYVPKNSLPIQDQAFDFAAFTAAIPEADRQNTYISVVRDLYDKYLTFFADFKFARSFFYREFAAVPFDPDPFKQADGVTAVSPRGTSVPLSNPFNPFTVPDAFLPDGTPVTTNVRYRALEAGPRIVQDTTEDYLYDAGLRGNLGEFGSYFKTWSYELGFREDINNHEEISSGIVSKPGLRAALLDTDPATAFNPFTRSGNTAAALSRVLVTLHHTGEATLTDEAAQVTGDAVNLRAGPISFALVTEQRRETISDNPDPLNTTFNTIGSVDLEASHGSRDVWSYFGELRIPITGPSWGALGLHSLEVDFAERVEFYSDTNLAERPKFSIRYQPLDSSLTLRASYTEAFHAPDLSDLSTSAEEFIAVAGQDLIDPAGTTADGTAVRILAGGQPKLRPEVAYEYSYGAVWTPKFIPGLTISVDYYHIDLRDRTNFIDPQFIVDHEQNFPGQVTRDSSGAIVLIRDLTQNISHSIVDGIDYELIYALETAIFGKGDFGKVTFTINGSYLSRYVAAINVGDAEAGYAGQETGFAGYLPHNRIYGSLFYDLGGLDTGVTVHYTGQGSDIAELTNSGLPRKIREWTTADAIISYTFHLTSPRTDNQVAGHTKNDSRNDQDKDVTPRSSAMPYFAGWRAWLNGTKITVGVNNIFDLDPPFVAAAGENGYDESAADIRGRFWFVALKKRF